MTKKTFPLFILFTFYFFIASAQAPRSYTSSEILLQLKKLNTVGSVLYIAAHPDDENTRLIAYLANEKCLRTGYLALTRGDGGQNLIGAEQGIELGIIRTQELLAARRIDGAEQFFTRAYDFGFSKTPKETFEKWNHDSVLGDMVWVIRNFRPDIIITRFATDGSGGHGHHTASAILAEEAFDAAADPKRFPEQLKYVDVWQTRRMFYNSAARFFNPNADLSKLLKLDVGGYNALLGKSYGEIAAESRSMHRSQGFGSAKQRGESFEYFKPIKGDTTNLKDIFDGIDFSWKRMKGGEKVGEMIAKILKDYKVEEPEKSSDKLLPLYKEFTGKYNYHHDLALQLIQVLLGISIDAYTSNCNTSIKDTITQNYSLISRNLGDIKYRLVISENLNNKESIVDSIVNGTLQKNKQILISKKYFTNSSIENTELYYLKNGIKNNLFEIEDLRYRQFPNIQRISNATLTLYFKETELYFNLKQQYKWVDPSHGELYRPLVITPPVMINIEQKSIAFADEKEKEIKVNVKAGKDHAKFDLKFSLPAGWKIKPHPAMNVDEPSNIFGIKNLEMDKKGEDLSISLFVTAPSIETVAILKATAIVDGIEYSKGIKEIKYDHIPIQTWFPDAEAKLVKLDIKTKSKHIGYIPGAGDEVQQCLQQLGYEVTTLTDEKLSKENLSQFDAIVTGIRAYNTNEKLPNYKQKLMDYVSDGGNLIVQYNTNNFLSQLNGNIGPYPFKVTRDRVTDENAKVNFEIPNHPVLNIPNKITDKDFEGWIQERCIYTATDSTGKYEMPLSMADENEKPNKGSLIIAKHGKGNFIYTGLVFFRELPAGIPGAYRLFVNMIELGK
jgi:LmbE family N-acetylglucosaminyl deacetylase